MFSCAATISFPSPAGRYFRALLSALLAVAAIGSAIADTSPPSRVGRVGFIEGDVSFFADREDGWRKARLNYPVTSKNSIWSNGAAKAEVRIGAAAIRVDADSMLDFVRVDDALTELFVQRGRVNIRLRDDNNGDGERESYRVETTEGAVTLGNYGRYRIEAAHDRNETRIAVFAGRARFDNGSAQIAVEPGRMLVVRGTSTPSFKVESASETTFDRWAEARDQRWDDTHRRYAADRFISPQMTGYEDLDANGDWIDDREYGRVWSPRFTAADWAPYRYGAWSYVRPWGWTWIDDASWGFAPFHYGRWVQIRARWCWWPGDYRHRPVYAPALVGWHASSNWRVSVGVGTPIGWFPLGPREHYAPTYSNNVTYIRNINNVTNNITVINPPSRYVNRTNGSTVVNNRVVVNGEPVWQHATIGNARALRQVKPAVDPHAAAPLGAPTFAIGEPPAPPSQAAPSAVRITTVVGEPARTPVWIHGETPRGSTQRSNAASTAPTAVIGRPVTTTAPASASAPFTAQVGQQIEEPQPIARPKPNPRVLPSTPQMPQPAPSLAPTQSPRHDGQQTVTTKPGVLREATAIGGAAVEQPQRVDGPVRTKESNVVRVERAGQNERSERHEARVQRTEGAAVQVKPRELKESKPAERNNEVPTANSSGGKVGQSRADERGPKTAPQ